VDIAAREPGRLHSWKEIAAYLNHGVRTVQRWEAAEGLPVHRHSHDKRDAVYAYRAELDAWWREGRSRLETTAEPAPARWRGWMAGRRRTLAACGALVVLAAAAGIFWAWHSRPAVGFVQRDWVVVADFENRTGEPLFDDSLLTAFTLGLEQSSHLNVVSRVRIAAALRRMGKPAETRVDALTGREICLRENARALIVCGVTRSGRRYALSARLVDPQTGDDVRSYVELAATQDAVLGALTTILSRLRRDLGETLASIRSSDMPLAQATTPSLQALKLYTEGRELWRKGKNREAMALYEAGLAQDPDFALLHAALGTAYASSTMSDPERARKHYEKALQSSDRVTERERLLVRALYASDFGRADEAADLYRAYLRLYPDDHSVRYSLANYLMQTRRYDEAAEQYKEVVRLWPASGGAWVNLATCRTLSGKPAEALPNWEKAFELEPTWLTSGSSLTHEYGFTLVAAGQAAKARLVFQRAYEKGGSPSLMLRSLALLDMYEGKFRDARRELQQAVLLAGQTQNYMHAARHHEFLAILAEAEGDRAGFRREAEAAAREMSRSTWQTALNARIGALFARAGALDRAEASLATVRRHADSAGQLETGYRNYLEGSIALARGQRSRAAELLEAAAASAEEALALGPLAQAYAGMQEQDRAIACLERLTRMPAQPLGWEAQQPWLEAHAGLAEQYLARGRKAEAAAVIRPLLELWREADSSLPLRVRLNRLAEAVK